MIVGLQRRRRNAASRWVDFSGRSLRRESPRAGWVEPGIAIVVNEARKMKVYR
jgi:hypothetical protein